MKNFIKSSLKRAKKNHKLVMDAYEIQKKMKAVEKSQDPAEIKQLMDEIEEAQKEVDLQKITY